MWLTDLQSAMAELFQIYGMWCCVERISQNVVTMTNGDKWRITGEGHVERIRKNQQGHFLLLLFSAPRPRSMGAEFSIIPPRQQFVKGKVAQKTKNIFSRICAFCTIDFWSMVWYYNGVKGRWKPLPSCGSSGERNRKKM